MDFLTVALLAIIQGLAELLPVSSSAHVILASKILGLNPSTPAMSFLIVMLHTGTMFAVLIYFWKRWKERLSIPYLKQIVLATAVTGALGYSLKLIIEKIFLEKIMGYPKGEIEQLFSMLPLVGAAVLISGIVIIASGLLSSRRKLPSFSKKADRVLEYRDSVWMGLVQGLVLPFRGLTRSGMTISTGLLRGLDQKETEDFSFALAVALTPAVLGHEILRWVHSVKESGQSVDWMSSLTPGFLGMALSFMSGLLALKWLSRWLENGKWYFFGIYCLMFSLVLFMSAEVMS
jgi:undecaprenyl-diphosphatase